MDIPLILTAIIFFCIGWLRGHYIGKLDQISESENRATKLAVRKEKELMYQD